MRGYTLHAESLASKWGFGDGDGLDDYLYDLQDDGLIDDMPERNDFLYKVVMRYLVPELVRHGVQTNIIKIESNHNPVRAYSVNDVEIEHDKNMAPACLWGIEVTVPREEIIRMVKHQ